MGISRPVRISHSRAGTATITFMWRRYCRECSSARLKFPACLSALNGCDAPALRHMAQQAALRDFTQIILYRTQPTCPRVNTANQEVSGTARVAHGHVDTNIVSTY